MIRRATPKEIKYACEKFHYAHVVPSCKYVYSYFNAGGGWCGVVVYSAGANRNIGRPYGLFMGEVLELVRVALNGKQEHTSQVVAETLRRLHKDAPNVKMVLSYADSGQGHVGTIYQATNWLYVGDSKDQPYFVIDGKPRHKKFLDSRGWPASIDWIREHVDSKAYLKSGGDKRKYLYFFDRKTRKRLGHLAKPYPKASEE